MCPDIDDNKASSDNKQTTDTESHGGDVYCITVENNHTVMAGRNGNMQWTGNSLYGGLAWDKFRLYHKDMGAAVTATGRGVIQFTDQVVNDLSYEVTYADTDSVIITLGSDVSKDDAIEIGHELATEMNNRYDECAESLNAQEHRFQMEFEKLYKLYFQVRKKRRCCGHIVWQEGQDVYDIDITGFEYKRSDTPRFVRTTQKNMLDMIVRGHELTDIRTYIEEQVENVKAGDVPLDDIAIPGGIGKKLESYNPPNVHLKGAIYVTFYWARTSVRAPNPNVSLSSVC